MPVYAYTVQQTATGGGGGGSDPEATTNQRYVLQSATGAGTGLDWTNAFTSLPATLLRDTTYWIGDGAYASNYTVDDAVSGTQVIRIKKATTTLHGTDTGWSSTFGDGQATLGVITINKSYVIVDGSTRNESDWFSGSAYGFQIGTASDQAQVNIDFASTSPTNVMIKYAYLPGFAETATAVRAYAIDGDQFGSGECSGIVISHVYVQDSNNIFFLRDSRGSIVEYCASDGAWSNTNNHGEIVNVYFSVFDIVIRYNKIRNAYMTAGGNGTALVAIAVARTQPEKPAGEFYGNVCWNFATGDGAVGFSGNVTNGGNATNWKCYNNTFVDGTSFNTGFTFPDGSGNDIRNNLWINCNNPNIDPGASPVAVDRNAYSDSAGDGTNAQLNVSTSIFVNYAGADYRLASATTAGATLSAPYNTDLLGNTRGADGTWDRGAYEKT